METKNTDVQTRFYVTLIIILILRGRAVYAYVFLKNVDGQGTQAIIKNLNLKKLKRF